MSLMHKVWPSTYYKQQRTSVVLTASNKCTKIDNCRTVQANRLGMLTSCLYTHTYQPSDSIRTADSNTTLTRITFDIEQTHKFAANIFYRSIWAISCSIDLIDEVWAYFNVILWSRKGTSSFCKLPMQFLINDLLVVATIWWLLSVAVLFATSLRKYDNSAD